MNECDCQTTIVHQDKVAKVKEQIKKEEKIIDMADFFKIFGDSTRLRIINALMYEKMCVCDIASVLNMSHSAISHQLITLKKYKIVKYEKIGKMVYYELDDNHIKKIFKQGEEHIDE